MVKSVVFQVAVLASHWGDGYYHFVMEGLPRIMPVLDVLLEHEDIKVRFTADLCGAVVVARDEMTRQIESPAGEMRCKLN